MGRKFTVQFDNVSVSAAQDFFEVISTASQVIRVLSAFIGQSGTADFGDAQAEGLRILIKRASGSYTTGSGGTTATPAPHDFVSPAFGGTVRANSTTAAVVGTGALTTISAETFNVQAGWYYTPTPEEWIELNPSQAIIFNLPVAPSDALSAVSGRVTFEVIGAS